METGAMCLLLLKSVTYISEYNILTRVTMPAKDGINLNDFSIFYRFCQLLFDLIIILMVPI